jgi:hypothetical protein
MAQSSYCHLSKQWQSQLDPRAGLHVSPASSTSTGCRDHSTTDGTGVRPGTIQRNGRREVSLVLDPAAADRGPLPAGKPSWVQFGPYEAVSITRQGNTVTATLDLPADASVGMLLDCHLEFDTGGRMRVLKKNDVLRVSE